MDIGFVRRVIFTSIGRKFVMAVTGLALGAFILVHLAGNLLLLKGEAAYDGYVALLLANMVTGLRREILDNAAGIFDHAKERKAAAEVQEKIEDLYKTIGEITMENELCAQR